jgi:hypothetical protein
VPRVPRAVLADKTLVLLIGVLAGLLAGLIRAWFHKSKLHIPDLRLVGFVLAAFILQVIGLYLPGRGRSLPVLVVSFALVGSQVLLLVFAWGNRRLAGVWLLGLGLLLNLAVIVLNGGLMPISPETVLRLAPQTPPGLLTIGARLGVTKDVVLSEAQTSLAFLSDRFILPNPFTKGSSGNAAAAFSLGDVVIAVGAFWVLWSFGRTSEMP